MLLILVGNPETLLIFLNITSLLFESTLLIQEEWISSPDTDISGFMESLVTLLSMNVEFSIAKVLESNTVPTQKKKIIIPEEITAFSIRRPMNG